MLLTMAGLVPAETTLLCPHSSFLPGSEACIVTDALPDIALMVCSTTAQNCFSLAAKVMDHIKCTIASESKSPSAH